MTKEEFLNIGRGMSAEARRQFHEQAMALYAGKVVRVIEAVPCEENNGRCGVDGDTQLGPRDK
jgi:hypothetical protein